MIDAMYETERTATCVVCNGTVVEETTMEYYGDPRHMIIGPGSRNQMTPHTTIHCTKCGIKYAFLPGADVDKPIHFTSMSGSLSPEMSAAIDEARRDREAAAILRVLGSPCPTCGASPRRASCPTKCDEL